MRMKFSQTPPQAMAEQTMTLRRDCDQVWHAFRQTGGDLGTSTVSATDRQVESLGGGVLRQIRMFAHRISPKSAHTLGPIL
jgi:hypothetical protein